MFRKMRRFKQQLTDDACAEVLKNGQRGILAVLGDEGYPYTVPLDYVYTDGKLYFHSAAEGHKVDAVRAEPEASFCVLAQREQDADGWSYYFDSVVVFGKVQIIEDEEERLHALRLLGLKYFPDAQMVEDDLRKNAARALVLCLHAAHISGKHVHER